MGDDSQCCDRGLHRRVTTVAFAVARSARSRAWARVKCGGRSHPVWTLSHRFEVPTRTSNRSVEPRYRPVTSQQPAVEKTRLEATHVPLPSIASLAPARKVPTPSRRRARIAGIPNGRVNHGILMTQPRGWCTTSPRKADAIVHNGPDPTTGSPLANRATSRGTRAGGTAAIARAHGRESASGTVVVVVDAGIADP